jgi:curved DNA-binding protein CbpA
MREQQLEYEAARQAREERRAKRKKSAKQLAREAQEQADAHQSSQSIREVYRKLASALHPDREPDAQERERKTGLMQRANQAYAKNNLLQLLELQLELEHIDQASINNIGEDRLKHYNKVLKEQLVELEHEILHVEAGFKAQFGISPFEGVSPHNILRDLERDIAVHRQTLSDMHEDLIAFEDIKTLKSSLRELRRRPRMKDDLDDLPF